MTIKDALALSGYTYQSRFTMRADDIDFNSTTDICYSLGYILGHLNRIDVEIPEEQSQIKGSYPISNTVTTSGNKMKQAPQYRIYLTTTRNIPPELAGRLQNDSQNRITGSRFVEACLQMGFVPGNVQNPTAIRSKVAACFSQQDLNAFDRGCYA